MLELVNVDVMVYVVFVNYLLIVISMLSVCLIPLK